MKKIMNTLFFTAVALVALSQENPVYKEESTDPLFPHKQKFNAGVLFTYSGITPPPAIIADVTYGVSRKLSLGIVGGTTGALAVYGLKMNAVLFQKKDFRSVIRMISDYYPERNGTFLFDKSQKQVMPWMLSMGVVDAEWKSEKGIRWSLGMGAIETHCVEDMKMWFHSIHKHMGETDEKFFDVFFTLQGSVSIPVSKKLFIRPEVFAVFREGKLIKRNEFKVAFPINPYVNFIYTF